MQTSGRVVSDMNEDHKIRANVDVIGLGAGVVDRAKEVLADRPGQVVGVNVAEAAADTERFANVRAEAYWQLRQSFETGSIMISTRLPRRFGHSSRRRASREGSRTFAT